MTTMTAPARTAEATFHGVQRRLAAVAAAQVWPESPPALELSTLGAQEPPRLIAATLLEDRTLQAHPAEPAATPRFAAFLDGTQTSRVLAHVDGLPIVHGTVAAVVRQRVDRRLLTWNAPHVRRALYAPLRMLPAAWRHTLEATGLPVLDTLADGPLESTHPFALQDAAIHAVQQAREHEERLLAEQWCGTADGELFVDGAIGGSETLATSQRIVGVVKSHRTLYADGDALRCLMLLAQGDRTSAFRITSRKRIPVASWYLRLRESKGRDPLWGLVRIEVAEPSGGARAVSRRADEVSAWVLAEALPLSVPDARWDKMVYGIRDCEQFLRALQ